MNKNGKRNFLLTVVALIVLFGLSCFVQGEVDAYIRRIVNLCLIYAIIGLSMNITNGFAGQFSLGQAGFMAIGAYMVGIFTVPVNLRADVFYAVPMNPHLVNIYMPLWLALIMGGILAAIVAGLIGTPVLRLRGDYLAIATLGFSEIIRIIITNANTITNGASRMRERLSRLGMLNEREPMKLTSPPDESERCGSRPAKSVYYLTDKGSGTDLGGSSGKRDSFL